MNRFSPHSLLRWISLLLLVAALILTIFQLVDFSRVRSDFPRGLTVAEIPVGGVDRQTAAERLQQAYSVAVEVHYGEAVFQIRPSLLGFELDLESMLSAADQQRVDQSFWIGFWDYLWNRIQPVSPVPLVASYSEDRLKKYLAEEVAARYDQPSKSAAPVPGSVNFQPGQPGTVLDINRAVNLIGDALRSPNDRVVKLTYGRTSPARPSLQDLRILLQQIVDVSQFEGISEVYLQDLQTKQNLHFAYQSGETKPLIPDIAYSSWSTIKIPVLVSAFRRLPEPAPNEALQLMKRMIENSDNDSTDRLASTVIDKNLAPLIVTQDMQAIGLNNTLWGGFFYIGAPLLKRFETPANKRTDIDTGPDVYDQTTPSDMGMLMEDIYDCAQYGGGTLIAAFPGEISQKECQQMISYMANNQIGVLIQAGVPGGTQVAHKHGWANETDGLIHTMGDVAIVYTPMGNYVLVIFVHDPKQILFTPVNQMVAEMSQAVYNFFNVPVE